jgi:hypothetical protein
VEEETQTELAVGWRKCHGEGQGGDVSGRAALA